MPLSEQSSAINTAERVEDFVYPTASHTPFAPYWGGFAGEIDAAQGDSTQAARREHVRGAVEETAQAERVDWEERLAEERGKAFENGRERGHLAERQAQAAALASAEEKRVRQAVQLVESFGLERDRYLQAVEQEVVKLALAVAARILRREAQMDPLLLTGAVRVALGQLAQSTEATLRVPADELELWTEAVSLLPNLPVKPAVCAGEGMRAGDCAIATKIGTVDIGIRSQLGEIERGFFDRAQGERVGREPDKESKQSAPVAGRESRA